MLQVLQVFARNEQQQVQCIVNISQETSLYIFLLQRFFIIFYYYFFNAMHKS